jgi:hypothetical protein
MRYFLETVLNGFGRELIAIAPVPEDDDRLAFFEAIECARPPPGSLRTSSRCWRPSRFGSMMLRSALPRSCSTTQILLSSQNGPRTLPTPRKAGYRSGLHEPRPKHPF